MLLRTDQKRQLDKLAKQLNLELIILYGSQVAGHARPDSDLDIAVLIKQSPDYAVFKKIYGEISTIFSGENVDLRFLNDADGLFIMQVVKQGILLSGDKDYFDEFKMLANRRYIDDGVKYFPFRDQLLQEQQKRLRR